ncbi:MAG: multidrug efflux RND transporter permease subunit [Hyphomicrobiaceae bacterium]
MISDIFIKRPRMAIVIALVITIAGLISILSIPVAQYPDIAPPTVQVAASYSGADARTVEESVAQPLESVVNGVSDMRYMKSTSSNDGSYTLSVSFSLAANPDIATVNVQNNTKQAEAKLPEDVRRSGLSIKKVSTSLLQVFTFHSSKPEHDQLFISNFVTINIVDELKRVPGVGDVVNFGARDYAMRIWIDPEKLASLNLTSQDVIAAVASQNTQAAAGRIGAAPLSEDQRLQLTITTKGRLTDPDEFGNIIVRGELDGSVVRVKDVARVELGGKTYDSISTFDGKPSSPLGVYLSPGANAVEVANAVSKRLEDLRPRFPEGITYSYIYNTADFVGQMIDKVVHTLGEAFALVALVVFVFLGRWRATLIPLLAVPVSVIGTFAILLAVGFSANMISLLAMVLVIGLVVDDAIVVVENVERILEEHPELTVPEATHKAMSEITGAIIAITLVLLSVFVPVAFLPGSSGVLFRQFAITISAAMVISAIVALTLAPALCAVFLKPGHPKGIMKTITGAINATGNGFASVVTRLVRVAAVSLAVVFALGLATRFLMSATPAGFLPAEDQGYLITVVTLPAGASLNRTQEAMLKAEAILRKEPTVGNVVSIAGFDLLGGGSASNSGVMFSRLKDYDLRTSPNAHSTVVAPRLTRALAVIPDGMFFTLNPPSIPGMGTTGGFEFMLEALQGQELSEMAAVARGLILAASQRPELTGVFTTFDASTPQIRLTIDRDKVAVLGVNLSDLFSVLQSSLGSYYINDFNSFGRTWQVMVQAEQDYRKSISQIYDLKVKNASGEMVPLSSLVLADLEASPRAITRYNNYRAISITGNAAPGHGDGDAIQAMEELARTTLPNGYGYEWTGQALETKAAAGQTGIVLGFGLLFAYLFLVALYESWNIPIPVLLSVSAAILGAIFGVWVMGANFDLYAQIGTVMLIALAAKNAILIVEVAVQLREEGNDIVHAAIHASHQRFRPVMMTSIAFIAGLVPLIIAHGPGADSMYAVGLPVIFGMLAASFAGILIIPMLYVTFQHLREGNWFGRRNARGEGDTAPPAATS